MGRQVGFGGFGFLLGFGVGLILGVAGLEMYCFMIMDLQDKGQEVTWPIPIGLGNQGFTLKCVLDAEAKKTENDKAFEKAIADYTESIRLDVGRVQAACDYFGRAIVYDKRGDADRAISDYSLAILMDPQSVQAYRCRAIAYAKRGQAEMAIADMTKAIRLDTGDARMYINRGIAYCGKRDYNKAIADFSEAIRLDLKCADAHYNRAIAYGKMGKNDKAAKDFDRAKMVGHKAM